MLTTGSTARMVTFAHLGLFLEFLIQTPREVPASDPFVFWEAGSCLAKASAGLHMLQLQRI
jgi:hypothetical protein